MAKNILHWLEAMSMLGRSRSTVSMLEQLHAWVISMAPGEDDLHELVYDTYRFAGFFSNTITEHPSLVYLSALPFAPTNSRLYQLFHHSGLPCVLSGFQKWWSPSLRVLHDANQPLVTESVAFSLDGSKVVSSGGGGIRIWDTLTGIEAIPVLKTEAEKNFVTFSPDGLEIWSGSNHGTILILDAATGIEVCPPLLQEQWDLDATSSPDFNRVAFSPDRSRVALGSRNGALHIIDLATGREACPALEDASFENASSMIGSIDFSPDGSRIASGSNQGVIYILDAKTSDAVAPNLEGHTAEVTLVKFSLDGTKVISGSSDGTIRTWDSATGRELHLSRIEKSDGILPLAFSTDRSRMVSSSYDDTIQIWDVKTGERVGPGLQGHWARTLSAAFSFDSSRLVSGPFRDNIRIWDVTPGRKSNPKMRRHTYAPEKLAFSPDGLTIKSKATDGSRIWDAVTGRELKNENLDDVEFSPDGSISLPSGESMPLLDAQTSEVVERNEEHFNWIASLSSASSESGPSLSALENGTIVCKGKAIWRLPLDLLYPSSSNFRGQYIAFGIQSGQVFVVHLPAGLVV